MKFLNPLLSLGMLVLAILLVPACGGGNSGTSTATMMQAAPQDHVVHVSTLLAPSGGNPPYKGKASVIKAAAPVGPLVVNSASTGTVLMTTPFTPTSAQDIIHCVSFVCTLVTPTTSNIDQLTLEILDSSGNLLGSTLLVIHGATLINTNTYVLAANTSINYSGVFAAAPTYPDVSYTLNVVATSIVGTDTFTLQDGQFSVLVSDNSTLVVDSANF
jgi:hypothetical protein